MGKKATFCWKTKIKYWFDRADSGIFPYSVRLKRGEDFPPPFVFGIASF